MWCDASLQMHCKHNFIDNVSWKAILEGFLQKHTYSLHIFYLIVVRALQKSKTKIQNEWNESNEIQRVCLVPNPKTVSEDA